VLAISTTPRRSTAPGTTLNLLVLTAGTGGCIGIDLASGALTRANYPVRTLVPLVPFDLASAPIVGGDEEPDPVHPEQVDLAQLPRLTGHLGRRRAERWLRPLLHPDTDMILGFPGPAVPFWELAGDRPSLAVIQPDRPPHLLHHKGEARLRCRFSWRSLWHELPVVGHGQDGDRRMVIALSAPLQGHCYKVVAGLLP
jgi:hypothetical protein